MNKMKYYTGKGNVSSVRSTNCYALVLTVRLLSAAAIADGFCHKVLLLYAPRRSRLPAILQAIQMEPHLLVLIPGYVRRNRINQVPSVERI